MGHHQVPQARPGSRNLPPSDERLPSPPGPQPSSLSSTLHLKRHQRSGRDRHRPVKTNAIHPRDPRRNADYVACAPLEWVDWFNHRRVLQPIGDIPPAEMEQAHSGQLQESARAVWLKPGTRRENQGDSVCTGHAETAPCRPYPFRTLARRANATTPTSPPVSSHVVDGSGTGARYVAPLSDEIVPPGVRTSM